MFDTNVHDFEVQSACYIQKCGVQRRKFDKLNLKSTYIMGKQTLFSTFLLPKNHTLSSTGLQALTLCSIKSCKSRILSILAWVYYFLMGATPPGTLHFNTSTFSFPSRCQILRKISDWHLRIRSPSWALLFNVMVYPFLPMIVSTLKICSGRCHRHRAQARTAVLVPDCPTPMTGHARRTQAHLP